MNIYIPASTLIDYIDCPRKAYLKFILREKPYSANIIQRKYDYIKNEEQLFKYAKNNFKKTEKIFLESDRYLISTSFYLITTFCDKRFPAFIGKHAHLSLYLLAKIVTGLICFEEASAKNIDRCLIFYPPETINLFVVSETEKQMILELLKRMLITFESGIIPNPIDSPRCNYCNLGSVCLKNEIRKIKALHPLVDETGR